MGKSFDVASLRSHFPALSGEQVYFDNAGGSQALKEVIDSVAGYLSSTNVQLGASYPVSAASTDLFNRGCRAAAKYVNAQPNEVVLGPSTTQLLRNLSLALYYHLSPGCEIILSKLDHEANVASWLQMAKWRGLTVRWWGATDARNPRLEPDVLRGLMSDKTRLVACTHTSNILGTINDIRAIADVVHSVKGAYLCVDAVAYAPHRQVDVKSLGADFYSFSWYKVYGPHIAVLYASESAQSSLESLGHYFKSRATLEEMLGLAGASYELAASIPQVCEYLSQIPWSDVASHEEEITEPLMSYLNSRSDIKIWGEPSSDPSKRVPVVSFTVAGRRSQEIVESVEKASAFGIRWGSFYSNRLVSEILGLDAGDGVVRVSLVHYNTIEEVRAFVRILDGVLGQGIRVKSLL